jgi:hypothetical protein
VPDAPTGLSAARLSNTRIDLSWTDASANEDSFRIERSLSDDSGFTTLTTLPAGSTFHSDTTVSDADTTRYFYRVFAVNTHGEAVSGVAAAGAPLPAPAALSASALSVDQARISWTFGGRASGFLIERRPTGGSLWTTAGQAAGSATSFDDTVSGLERNYQYRVSAFDDYFTGPVSSVANVTLPPKVEAADGNPREVNLIWADAAGEMGYRVRMRRSGSGPWITLSDAVAANITAYAVTGLIPDQSYDFRVEALDGNVPRTAAETTFVTQTVVSGFQQSDSAPYLVVMEAENYSAKGSNGSADSWEETTAFAGYSGTAAMQVGPDDNTFFNNNVGTAPVLSFEVNFNQTGTHYLWVRCRQPDVDGDSGDSLHGGINRTLSPEAEYIFRAGDANGYSIGANWVWAGKNNSSVRVSIEVPTAGLHTVNLWPREDGIIVDKILLTPDVNYQPGGGEGESAFNDGLVLTPLESWRQTHFGTVTAIGDAGNMANPAGDGLRNLMKFALGGTPWTSAGELEPGMEMVTYGDVSQPEFSFRRRQGTGSGSTETGYSVDGIIYRILGTEDLTSPNWRTGAAYLEEHAVDSNGDGTETVTVRILPPGDVWFLQLEVRTAD